MGFAGHHADDGRLDRTRHPSRRERSDTGLMLREFQTITIDGVLATIVHVHSDCAYEIEYHDDRDCRVVTLDLDPERTLKEMAVKIG